MMQSQNGDTPAGRISSFEGLLALGFFSVLTLVVTWPLLFHLGTRIPGWYIADNYEYLWKMWWFKHALLELGQNPLFAPDIFYPQGFNLAHAELTPLHTVLGLPLTALFGEIVAYNLFAMASFILGGWAVWKLVYRLTGQRWAGWLAGVIFILTPYHTVRYGGILPPTSFEGIPLFFLGLEGWIETRKSRWAALAGAGFLLAAWAYVYYAVGLILLAPVYALARMRPLAPFLKDRRTWRGVAFMLAMFLLTLIPLYLPYLQLGKEVQLQIPLDDVDFWSASLSDYLLPPGLHPLWGEWVRTKLLSIPADYPQIAYEFILGLGWLPLLFMAYGIGKERTPVRRAMLWMMGAALLLSMGPRLHVGRHAVILPAPEAVTTAFHTVLNALGRFLPSGESYQLLESDGLAIPLPALLLRWLLPPLTGMRAWNRFSVFVAYAGAVLAGLGYDHWRKEAESRLPARASRSKREALLAAVFLAGVTFELWPGAIPLQPVEARLVDAWLAEQPGDFAIMELPLTSALSAPQMQYTRYHGKRITFAYGTFFPYWYRQTYPELEDCPQQACLERLFGWDVRYILLNEEALPDGSGLEEAMMRSPSLEMIGRFDEIVVFELEYRLE